MLDPSDLGEVLNEMCGDYILDVELLKVFHVLYAV